MNCSNGSYGALLKDLGLRHQDVFVIDSGLATSMQTVEFQSAFPERYVNLGIAEANAVGFASGLARRGFRPYVHSFANFLARRALDQIAISAVLPGLPIVFVAGSCGLYDGKNGPSHFANADLAAMSSLPGMTVFEPADEADLDAIVEISACTPGPVYIRLRRHGLPKRLGTGMHGEPTRRIVASSAPRLTVVAIGSFLDETLTACHIAGDNGVPVDLFHVLRPKPLDLDQILTSARKSRRTVVVENHVAVGGTGQALAARLAEESLRCKIFGLPDGVLPAAEPGYLLRITKLDAISLAARLIALSEGEK